MKIVRIGAGAGFSGDRIEPAVELALKGELDYLVFECLAERTIALAQQARHRDPASGFDPLLRARMEAVLPACRSRGTRIVTNMGAANPFAAAREICEVARWLGLAGLKVAAVTGDDILNELRGRELPLDEGGTIASLENRLISANAYIGAKPIVEALSGGADIVVTGRAADPALFLGPLVHEFGWKFDDWARLGQGILVGHLLECAGQVTGGYFADPGIKDVPDLARLGFPIGEVGENGDVTITKVAGSGGAISAATVKEQLLYEIHDPSLYYQPDVVADFSNVEVREIGPDRVEVTGGGGTAKTGLLKTSVGFVDGYIGEGQISYAGPGAVSRARLALDIVRQRFSLMNLSTTDTRFDIIGIDALHGDKAARGHEPYEVRIRVSGRTTILSEAVRIGNEVEALYTNGPAGGGGAWKSTREVVAIASTLIPEDLPVLAIEMMET